MTVAWRLCTTDATERWRALAPIYSKWVVLTVTAIVTRLTAVLCSVAAVVPEVTLRTLAVGHAMP